MAYYPNYTSVIRRAALIGSVALLGLTLSLTTKAAPDAERLTAGFNALERLCFACHSPEPEPDQRIAPPISAIKKHYIERHADFQDFSVAFTGFVAHPTAERAILRGAIKRFGLMPQLSIDDASVADIAYYLYYTELKDPPWFAEHYEAEHGKPAKKAQRQHR
ncbi:MAG: hypothetical protein V2I45_04585 [Halieaceae bacterium]|jgi:hypothetical protein|nr:hypothetical protein [Halieaceae bacterium]